MLYMAQLWMERLPQTAFGNAALPVMTIFTFCPSGSLAY